VTLRTQQNRHLKIRANRINTERICQATGNSNQFSPKHLVTNITAKMSPRSLQERLEAEFRAQGSTAQSAKDEATRELTNIAALKTFLHDRILRIDDEQWAQLTGYVDVWPQGWTEEHETKMREQWQENPARSLIESNISPQLHVCRTVTAMYRCLPQTMLSRQHHLRPSRTRGNTTPDADYGYWTKNFAEALLKVALNPFWMGQPQALILAIQYAVICRTGDTQKWPLEMDEIGNKDAFLRRLKMEVSTAEEDAVIPLLRQASTQAVLEGLPLFDSPWSRLLARIESLAGQPEPHRGSEPYVVSQEDLALLANALEATTGVWGHRTPYTAELWALVIKEALPRPRTTDDNRVVPDEAQFREFSKKLVFAEMRLARPDNVPQRQPEAAPATGKRRRLEVAIPSKRRRTDVDVDDGNDNGAHFNDDPMFIDQQQPDPGNPQAEAPAEPARQKAAQQQPDPGNPQAEAPAEPDRQQAAQQQPDPGNPQAEAPAEPDRQEAPETQTGSGHPDAADAQWAALLFTPPFVQQDETPALEEDIFQELITAPFGFPPGIDQLPGGTEGAMRHVESRAVPKLIPVPVRDRDEPVELSPLDLFGDLDELSIGMDLLGIKHEFPSFKNKANRGRRDDDSTSPDTSPSPPRPAAGPLTSNTHSRAPRMR
jgi:hypothetical protein